MRCRASAGLDSVHAFERKKYVLLAPFDRVSAFECAMLDRGAMNGPQQDKRDGATQPWQLVKVDRQIIAIGKANGATVFVTRDGRARTTAMRCGMAVWELADLPLSPEDQQTKLPLALPKGSQRGTPRVPAHARTSAPSAASACGACETSGRLASLRRAT